MKIGWALILGVLLVAGDVGADILVTREGDRIETDGPWKVNGRQVVFTAANGRLSSMRLSQVDLEASEEATALASQTANTVDVAVETDKDADEQISPLTRLILETYRAEKKESVRSLTHQDIPAVWPDGWDAAAGEEQMRRFRAGVVRAMGELDRLSVGYDLSTAEGLRQAGGEIRRIADDLDELSRKPLPRGAYRERYPVKKLVERLKELVSLTFSDPEAALRMLDQAGWKN